MAKPMMVWSSSQSRTRNLLALSLVIGLTGGYESRWIGLGYLSAISALIAKAAMRPEQGSVGWRSLPLRYLPLALFLMPFVMHAAMLPLAAALGRLGGSGQRVYGLRPSLMAR